MTPRRIGPLERLPQAVAEQVVRRVVEMLDIDEIVKQVDVNAVVQRVDVNAVLAKVDVDAIVDRVDIDRIVDRIDVNAIADKIDIDGLVKKADLGDIIAQSTSGMMGEFLGLLRRQVVSLDDLLDKVTLHGRRTKGRPLAPEALMDVGPQIGKPNREGQYAGGITRLLSIILDITAAWGAFLLLTLSIDAAIHLITGSNYTLFSHRLASLIANIIWGFLYFSLQWSLSGRTFGMAVFGARVVTVQGHAIAGRAAAIRTLVLPFSILLWPFALSEIVLRGDRRTMHDLSAGTCVVYHWQARGASLPWLQNDD